MKRGGLDTSPLRSTGVGFAAFSPGRRRSLRRRTRPAFTRAHMLSPMRQRRPRTPNRPTSSTYAHHHHCTTFRSIFLRCRRWGRACVMMASDLWSPYAASHLRGAPVAPEPTSRSNPTTSWPWADPVLDHSQSAAGISATRSRTRISGSQRRFSIEDSFLAWAGWRIHPSTK